jgi:molecular chaperone GrpE
MCFAMQEPMKENQDPNTDENSVEENVSDKVEVISEETPEAEETAEPVVELDPWEQLEQDAAKWKDQAIRTAAELDNYRKRMSREKLDAVRFGNQGLLEELLPVLDNFNMGMQAAAQEQGSMLYMGMDMVHKQIGEFLSTQGVEEIAVEAGGEFNPNLHEALSQEASEDVEADKIVRVIRKGYKMGERLLRPANVIVSLGKETPTELESE